MAGSRWEPTDVMDHIPSEVNKIPPFDPKTGRHLWLMIAAYSVDPATWSPNEPARLDSTALVSITGPGCFYCETAYSQAKHTRCKGRP